MKFKLIAAIFLFFLAGCKEKTVGSRDKSLKDNRIIRFDREVAALNKHHPEVGTLKEKYGYFFDVYTTGVLQLGQVTDPDFPRLFALFLQDSVIQEVSDSVARKYRDMSLQEEELKKAFRYYAGLFPGYLIPEVYTHISGFNQSVIVDSNFVSVSLDNYLGENCVFYKLLSTPIPLYMRRKMTEKYIVRDILFGWLTAEFPYRPLQNDLISGAVYQGKMVYLLEKLLPDSSLEQLFGYTEEQKEWCEKNEGEMWRFLVENEYVFSTQQLLLRKYLFDAPFSSGMPSESPGRAVVWNGYHIVRDYVKNSRISPESLAKEQDYHKILRHSRYRP